jgi:RNA polymerase sigma-70 factor (ECF subfamily)
MVEAASEGGSPCDRRDDTEWVRQLQAGKADAFERLVRTFGGRLLAVARRYVGNEADAEDVVQTAFLNAFRAMHQFRNECQLATWLHRIVVNAALMTLRARRRKPEASIESLLPAFQSDGHHVEQFSAWGVPIDRLMEQHETRAMVRACIEQLPGNYRVVLLLRDAEEFSTQEAAEMLMMTPTAVKVRLHRARQALATLLRKQFAQATEAARPVPIPRTGEAV